MYTATRPSCAITGLAPSCAKRPSAVRLTGVLRRIERIDLDDPAEAERFGRLDGQIETRVGDCPSCRATAPSTCESADAPRR